MTKDDFKKMPFDPFAASTMVQMYPVLQRVPLFNSEPDLNAGSEYSERFLSMKDVDKMIRFCIIFVDPRNNPLSEESDLEYRAKKAWELLNVAPSNDLVTLQKSKHWWFRKMIGEVLKLCFSSKYALWFAAKVSFYESLKFLMEPVEAHSIDEKTAKIRMSVMEDMKKMESYISTLEASMFKSAEIVEIAVVEAFFPDRLAEKYALDYTTN